MRTKYLIMVGLVSMILNWTGEGWSAGPPTPSVTVSNFPTVQTTEVGSQAYIVKGLAEFENDDYFFANAGQFTVPSGMILILDSAMINPHSTVTNDALIGKVSLTITTPDTTTFRLSTDMKPLMVELNGSTYVALQPTWALPQTHIPSGSIVYLGMWQNYKDYALDFDVIVSGHLVPEIASE